MSTPLRALSMLALGGLVGCAADHKACDPNAPGTICTVAGQGTSGYGGDNGPAVDSYLWWPEDTVIAPNGELWIEDFNNYLVRAVNDQGQIRTVVGTGLLGDSPDAGQDKCPALAAQFNHTTSLLFNDGWLYLAAWHGSRIKRVNYADMTLENFAGAGVRTLYTGDEGPALKAAFDLPTSMAVDSKGNVAVMDQANQVIRSIDTAGVVHRIAGKCVIELQPCATGEQPTLCPGSDKYVCGNPAEFCGTQATTGYMGTADCALAYAGDGGPALELRMGQEYGQMARPSGRIAYDANDNLIFADSTNHRIRKINKADGIVNTIAGTGVAGYSGEGGPATTAQINFPVDVAAAPDGSVYFADFDNSCIRKIDPAGLIFTVAGKCSSNPDDWGFDGDGGPPTEATLNQASGIDLDVAHNKLWISDTYNNRVRVVNF